MFSTFDGEHGFAQSVHECPGFELNFGPQFLARGVFVVLQGAAFEGEEPFAQTLCTRATNARWDRGRCGTLGGGSFGGHTAVSDSKGQKFGNRPDVRQLSVDGHLACFGTERVAARN